MSPMERKARVVELTHQGKTAREISDLLGVTTRTVVRDRREMGIAKPVPRRLTDDEVRAVEQMLEDGCSYSEIARTFGVHLTCISQRFPGRGWTATQANEYRALLRKCGAI
jgi:hypothetical protein